MFLASKKDTKLFLGDKNMKNQDLIKDLDKYGKENEGNLDARKILFFVYLNYDKFNLGYLQEDFRYDFIFSLYPVFQRIAKDFTPNKASLTTYLNYIIKKQKNTFIRKNLSKSYLDGFCNNFYYQDTYEDFMVASPDEKYCITNEIYGENKEFGKKLVLLALRSSFYLTESHIEKLSKISGISKELLYEYTEKLNETNRKKIERCKRQIESINKSFAKKNALEKEFSYLNENHTKYEQTKKSKSFQTKKWQNNTQENKKPVIYTSIKEITKLLNIPYESYKKEINSIKRYYKDFSIEEL